MWLFINRVPMLLEKLIVKGLEKFVKLIKYSLKKIV